jgi:hypothetical protein
MHGPNGCNTTWSFWWSHVHIVNNLLMSLDCSITPVPSPIVGLLLFRVSRITAVIGVILMAMLTNRRCRQGSGGSVRWSLPVLAGWSLPRSPPGVAQHTEFLLLEWGQKLVFLIGVFPVFNDTGIKFSPGVNALGSRLGLASSPTRMAGISTLLATSMHRPNLAGLGGFISGLLVVESHICFLHGLKGHVGLALWIGGLGHNRCLDGLHGLVLDTLLEPKDLNTFSQ